MTAAPRDRAVRTYLATGRVVEIGAAFGDIDYRREIAEPLARVNRYHGQAADAHGNPLSVAEHCVHGADCLRAELLADGYSDRTAMFAAFAFLIHDGHEAVMSDPPRNFVAMLGLKFSGVAAHREIIHDAIDEIKADIDRQLGFEKPAIGAPDERVGIMDRRMAAAEITFCFAGAAERNNRPAPPMDVGLPDLVLPDINATGIPGFPADWRFWTWPRASGEWLSRFNHWRDCLYGIAPQGGGSF